MIYFILTNPITYLIINHVTEIHCLKEYNYVYTAIYGLYLIFSHMNFDFFNIPIIYLYFIYFNRRNKLIS